ncbi:hypothetical protein scyTo_0006011 [Scyliorhinus torazame]|uniref:Uncharacterized protein n=1 Tax=Scyliorhinus torazame TaxID=75743 RepID=A0A401PES1_SCYTO|nr:hypothetical protein [Scyliorhinus torazame]
MKDSTYAAENTENTVDKDTLVHAWLNLWPMTMLNDNDEQSEFHEFRMTDEKRMILDLLTYAKGTASVAVNKLEEMESICWNIEEVLNIDNEAQLFIQ